MKRYLLYFYLIASMLFIGPLHASASKVSVLVNSKTISVGDTIVARVVIDTEGQNINSSEGQLSIDTSSESFEIEAVSVAGSDFTIWLNPPTLSSDKKTVSFVGGIPGGVTSKNLKVFSLILKAVKTGEINLDPAKTSVFLNDGKGTAVAAKATGLRIQANESINQSHVNEWNDVILGDKIPPQPFIVSMGSDASVFDGKKFIAWTAVDNESGIDHYEVLEGDLGPSRVSASPYVLQNQNLVEKIQVTAFDKAGNSTVSIYEAKNKLITYLLAGIIVLVLVVVIAFFIRRKNKKIYVA